MQREAVSENEHQGAPAGLKMNNITLAGLQHREMKHVFFMDVMLEPVYPARNDIVFHAMPYSVACDTTSKSALISHFSNLWQFYS